MTTTMMKYTLTLVLVGLLSLQHGLKAQHVEFDKKNFPPDQHAALKEARERIKTGDVFFKEGLYATYRHALLYYLPAQAFNPYNAGLNFKIGVCYLKTSQKDLAVEYLQRAYELDSTVDKKITLYLAEAYHHALLMEQAIRFYEAWKSRLNPRKEVKEIAAIERRIAACQAAAELMQQPARVKLDNLGMQINSRWPDYHPVLSADESILFYTSSRPSTTGGKRSSDDLMYYEDILYSLMEGQQGAVAIQPGKPLNSKDHDAVAGLSLDGSMLILKSDGNRKDLYYSILEGDVWQKPQAFPKPIRSGATEYAASLGPDGLTLYFSSDRKGGFGGSDLYVVKRTLSGKWGKAENLGPGINTAGDEKGVFIHPDGRTLYFSSDGHTGMGGLDLFHALRQDSGWSAPVSLGYPINTPEDEESIWVSADKRHAYLASGRKGGLGDRDIYKVTFLGGEKPVVSQTEDRLLSTREIYVESTPEVPEVTFQDNRLCLFTGTVANAATGEKLAASIDVYDLDKATLYASFQSNAKSGKFVVALPAGRHYGLMIGQKGYLWHSVQQNLLESATYELMKSEVKLSKIEPGAMMRLQNVLFDERDASLLPAAMPELDRVVKLLRDNKKMRVEIRGGVPEGIDNQTAALAATSRASAVKEYLTMKGIEASRLEVGQDLQQGLDGQEVLIPANGISISIISL